MRDSSVGTDDRFASESPEVHDRVKPSPGDRCDRRGEGDRPLGISEIVDRFERPLIAYATRMLGGDRQSAQDAVQETFLRLCRQDREKISSRLAAWLFTVCRTRVIDMQRVQRTTAIDTSEMVVVDPHPLPADKVSEREEAEQLETLIGSLSDRQQEVLRLRMQAGLSYREIADVTGLTIGNVGFHLHQAVRRLRDGLSPG